MMKKIYTLLIALLLSGIVSGQWEIKYPDPDLKFFDIYFTDNYNGWAAGQGFIMNTTDGGNNWVTQYADTANSFGNIRFTTNSIGWCLNDSTDILFTTNGGDSWDKITYFHG